MPHASTLVPGNELHGWMKVGRALTVSRDEQGTITRVVPNKPRVALADDIVAFIGFVLSNDPVSRILTMQIGKMGPTGKLAAEHDYVAHVPYKYIDKLRLLSAQSFPARVDSPFHPTDQQKWAPYRTLTEVSLA